MISFPTSRSLVSGEALPLRSEGEREGERGGEGEACMAEASVASDGADAAGAAAGASTTTASAFFAATSSLCCCIKSPVAERVNAGGSSALPS